MCVNRESAKHGVHGMKNAAASRCSRQHGVRHRDATRWGRTIATCFRSCKSIVWLPSSGTDRADILSVVPADAAVGRRHQTRCGDSENAALVRRQPPSHSAKITCYFQAEVETIVQWVDAGAIGNAKDAPPPAYPEEAFLDLDGPESSTPQGSGMKATVTGLGLGVLK
jgi:hypothetical protein